MAITKVSRGLLNTGVSDSSDATAITIDSSERVGIGLTSPASPLHVRVASDANFEVENASGSVRLAALNDARSVNVNMEFTSTHFGFLTGNLGLGTTTINTGTLGTANKFLEVAAGTSGGSGTIVLSRTTNGNNNEIGGLRFVNTDNADDDGLDSDGKLVAAVSARSVTSDSNASDDSGANLLFYTKPEAGNYAERIRITSAGNLLVGTTTALNSSHTILKNGGVPLHVKRTTDPSAGNSLFLGFGTGGSTSNVSIRGDGDLENTNDNYGPLVSDERLKENIVDVSSQWEDVKNIKLKNFTYKNDPSGLVQMGPIAQELEKVSPNLIKRREASPQDIENSGGLIKEGDEVLTYKSSVMKLKAFVALQEAMTKIEELQAIIEDLQKQINEVKNGN